MDLPITLSAEQKQAIGDRLRNPLAIITTAMELALMYPDPEEDLHRKRAALLAAQRLSNALKESFGI